MNGIWKALIWWHRGLTASSPLPMVTAKNSHLNKSISPSLTLKDPGNREKLLIKFKQLLKFQMK